MVFNLKIDSVYIGVRHRIRLTFEKGIQRSSTWFAATDQKCISGQKVREINQNTYRVFIHHFQILGQIKRQPIELGCLC